MNVFQSYLDHRDEQASRWMDHERQPADRLVKFDRWVRQELASRLLWPSDPVKSSKLLEQCKIEVDGLVRQLWQRGWMLDGAALARHIITALDAIGAAQRAGKVEDFWPYYHAVMQRYVGSNAEEIQAEALRLGSSVAAVMKRVIMGGAGGAIKAPTDMTSLVATRREETLREKVTRWKRDEAAQRRTSNQLKMLFA